MSQSFMKKLFWFITFVFVGVYLFSAMYLNTPAPKKVDGSESDLTGVNFRKVSRVTFDGASMFLKSYSDALLLLNTYELSGVTDFDYSYALRLVNSSIVTLNMSTDVYREILLMSENDEQMLEKSAKFMKFDYSGFAEKRQLNREVMESVANCLSKGHMKGAFEHSVKSHGEILATLENIKSKLENKLIPDIEVFWKLMQQYAESSLFGNYTSLVFYNI